MFLEYAKPGKMCIGPDNTILVYDWNSQTILQLAFNGDTFEHIQQQFNPFDLRPRSMCYVEFSDILVVALPTGVNTFDIVGFDLAREEPHISWKVPDIKGSTSKIHSVYGGVLVASDDRLLDSVDGSMVTVRKNESDIRHITCSCPHGTGRIAICHGPGNIQCYTVSPEQEANGSEKWQIRIPG